MMARRRGENEGWCNWPQWSPNLLRSILCNLLLDAMCLGVVVFLWELVMGCGISCDQLYFMIFLIVHYNGLRDFGVHTIWQLVRRRRMDRLPAHDMTTSAG